MTTTDTPGPRTWDASQLGGWAGRVHPTPLCGAPHPGHPGHTCTRPAGHLRDGLHWSQLGTWPDDAPRLHGYVTPPKEGVPVLTTCGVVRIGTDTAIAVCLPVAGAAWVRVLAPVQGAMRAEDMPPWGVW